MHILPITIHNNVQPMDTYPKKWSEKQSGFHIYDGLCKGYQRFFFISLLEAFQPKNFAYIIMMKVFQRVLCVKGWRRTVEIGELIPMLFTESE